MPLPFALEPERTAVLAMDLQPSILSNLADACVPRPGHSRAEAPRASGTRPTGRYFSAPACAAGFVSYFPFMTRKSSHASVVLFECGTPAGIRMYEPGP